MRFAIGLVVCILIGSVAPAAEKMYSLGRGRGAIILNVPDDWDDFSGNPRAGSDQPAHIEFSAEETDGPPFRMTIKPVPPHSEGGPMTTQPAMIKTLARRMIEAGARFPVDKLLQPIEGKSARGYWFDGTPQVGFEECCSGGVVAVGNVILSVEVTHDRDSPATKLARDMITAATIDKSAQLFAPPEPAQRRLQSPDGTWDLVFDAPGMQRNFDFTSRHRKTRNFMAMDWNRGLMLQVHLEPAVKPEAGDDAKAVREYYQSRGNPQSRPNLEIEDGQQGPAEAVGRLRRRTDPDAQQSRFLYLAHGGIWVTVYATATTGDKSTIKALDDLIASIHIEPHPPVPSTTAPTAAATQPATGVRD